MFSFFCNCLLVFQWKWWGSHEDHVASALESKPPQIKPTPLMVVRARRALLRPQAADALEAITVEDKRHAAARLFNQLPVPAQAFSTESTGLVLPGDQGLL